MADSGDLKPLLYLIFKTSSWTHFIKETSIPGKGVTSTEQTTKDLSAQF